MKSLIIAVVVLSALPAAAERRANKPFSTANGRTVVGAPAAPRVITVNTPGGGAAANLPPAAGRAPAVTNDMINGAPSDGGRAFMGGGRAAMSRTQGRAVRQGGKAFRTSGGRSIGADAGAGGDGGATTTTSSEEAPPHYSKPGALIRTTGQQPVYEKAETRTHTVDAGEIVFNKRKGFDVGRAPSVQQGPKDTPPPPNPGTAGSGYGGGAAANAPASSSGGSGSNDNNGSGNNGKDKPGDDYDQQGGDKAMTTSFYDAF